MRGLSYSYNLLDSYLFESFCWSSLSTRKFSLQCNLVVFWKRTFLLLPGEKEGKKMTRGCIAWPLFGACLAWCLLLYLRPVAEATIQGKQLNKITIHQKELPQVQDDQVEDERAKMVRRDESEKEEVAGLRVKRHTVDKEDLANKKKNKNKKPVDPLPELPNGCKQVWMAEEDLYAFVKVLKDNKVEQYLEYGGGASTLCASSLVKNVTTIEHNPEWCDTIKQSVRLSGATNVNVMCSPVHWIGVGSFAASSCVPRPLQLTRNLCRNLRQGRRHLL